MFTATLLEFKTNQAGSQIPAEAIVNKSRSIDSPGIHRGWQIID